MSKSDLASLIEGICLPDENLLPKSDYIRQTHALDEEELHDRKAWNHYLYISRMEPVLQFVTAHVPIGSRIIDVGCAQGNFCLLLGELGYQMLGVDLRLELLNYARLKLQIGTEKQREHVRFERMDIRHPSLQNQFDAVLFLEIVEHLSNPLQGVMAARSLMREDGIMVLSTPNGARLTSDAPSFEDVKHSKARTGFDSSAHGHQHVFEFRRSDLVAFLQEEARLDVIEVIPTASLVLMPFSRLGLALPYGIVSKINRVFGTRHMTCGYVAGCRKAP